MLPGLTLVALVVLAGTSDRTGRPGAVALLLVSLLWLRVNGPMEGRTILTFTPEHGFTIGDLAGVAGIGFAVWRFAAARRT